MSKLFSILKGDRVIWVVLVFLSMVSLLIVYSSTGSLAYRQMDGDTFSYLVKQFMMIMMGFGVIILIVNVIPVKFMSVFSPLLLLISLAFIFIALVLNIGSEATGRTFNLGPLSFQPAELAKISLVLFVSRILANNQDHQNKPSRRTFYWVLGVSGITCLAISMANFSTAAILFVSVVVVMFVGRVPLKYLFATLGAGMLVLALFYVLASHVDLGRIDTVKGRIDRFFSGDPNSEIGMTQADFAEMAIYNGGRFGTGPGGSEVRNHMAAAYNDFIFAILVEEYGWFSFLVVLAYVILAFRTAVIINHCNRTFPAFMVAGLSSMLLLQAMTNMGVAVGLLPVTGQTLPWISMGGTSTLFTAAAFGAILRVSHQNKLEKTNQKPLVDSESLLPDEDQAFAEVGAID
ncbi:MAG: FtsW/RodA/SpoVE family cell cycle protein [Prolixibacteraceae bacterium]|nr:FtsW/RodA/SpoVE family cell cycle protein [Prolixibacteraceae bacterium]MBN2648888.1 FtsW/RodA/SpoVE family cell cycle protein [Prolixibacteraceae bacterium]